MPGMPMSSGTGLEPSVDGYTLTLRSTAMSGMSMPVTFVVTKDGETVSQFDPEQTKRMHLYLIRSDLSGFQHLHPTMAGDGTWAVEPSALIAGSYRFYVQFLPRAHADKGALVLSRPVQVSGADATRSKPVPAPADTVTVDGYAVAVAGTPVAGKDTALTITLTRNSKPITDLQPYLDTYAHVTAIRAGDLAFAHLHPTGRVSGDHGGPSLTVNADLPRAGVYRMFIQFQTAGQLHTGALTISAS